MACHARRIPLFCNGPFASDSKLFKIGILVLKTAIITSFPRAQRVEVYNEMARSGEVDFRVIYLRKLPYGRHWKYGPKIEHDCTFIPEWRIHKHLYWSPGLLSDFRKYDPGMMIMTQYASPGMQMMMYLCSLKDIPWAFWSEAPHVRFMEDPIVKNEWLRSQLRRVAMFPIDRWASEVWAIGEKAKKEFQGALCGKSIVRNLPYYSDLDRFRDVGENREVSDKVHFLFSGSLSLRKGADIVAEAIKKLDAMGGLDFTVTIIGKGPLEHKFSTMSPSARGRVKIHGFVQMDEVPRYYGQANVLLFPSRHDGWGMTLPEGMAAGMVVISTAQTGSAVDLIRDGENGILLPVPTEELLVSAMSRLIRRPDMVVRMGVKARAIVQTHGHHAGAKNFIRFIKKFQSDYVRS